MTEMCGARRARLLYRRQLGWRITAVARWPHLPAVAVSAPARPPRSATNLRRMSLQHAPKAAHAGSARAHVPAQPCPTPAQPLMGAPQSAVRQACSSHQRLILC